MGKMWHVEDYETGDCIDDFESREAALQAIAAYAEQDRRDGTYEDGFYAIRFDGDGSVERIYMD